MKETPITKSTTAWSPIERFAFVNEYLALKEPERGLWLRQKGLTSELVQDWHETLLGAFQNGKKEPGTGKLKQEIKNLEHQLRRKERKLYQSGQIIEVQKKILEIFEGNQEE